MRIRIMTRTRYARMPLVASLAVLVATSAAAAPMLKQYIRVTADVVTIGDLIEDAGSLATVPLYRAPDLGTTGAVDAQQVIERARAAGLVGVRTGGLAEVIVSRQSQELTPEDMATRIAAEIAPRIGAAAASVEIVFDQKPSSAQADTGSRTPFRVLDLGLSPTTGRFDAIVQIDKGGQDERIRLRGTATEMVEVLNLTRAVQKGDLVQRADLAIQRLPRRQAQQIGQIEIEDVVGKAAKRQIRAGQTIAATDFGAPIVVHKGDLVTLVVEMPGMTLTIRGQAQEAGATGDKVAVVNEQSKRQVYGTITGPGRVVVKQTPTTVAAIGRTGQ
jgi:flagellar basal body P-ring formation protein FlgA